MGGSSDESYTGGGDVGEKKGKSNKRLSVERIYQKKTQLEHILLRPDTYIGSVETVTQPMWVYDGPEVGLVNRSVTFVPGLYKIFDEILVNAADNKQKSKEMDTLKIDIDPEKNRISIWNNGEGIPVVEHKDEKMYVPSLIFGHLLTSSNYDDEEKKVTGGRNGYGAKLCNIFSTRFMVETSCKSNGKLFQQTWKNNMSVANDPIIKSAKGADFTRITFSPDLSKFKMETLDKDIVALMARRALDVAGSTRGVKVYLNGTRLQIKNFKDYVDLYIKGRMDEQGNPLKIAYESVNERWEVAATVSDQGFQQVSFVNSIATTKGGKHADYVADQIVNKVIEVAKKKTAKTAVNIRPSQVKAHIWLFVNCLIENPTFDSQTKENMTLQMKSFGSKCVLSEKFIASAQKTGIVDAVKLWAEFKSKVNLDKKCSSTKLSKLKGVPKLEDANDAGTKHGVDCTLILTEGDSAKTVAVAGLGVIGRDRFGVFPLKGKILNVRDATNKQIMENAEINNIIKIVGLQYKRQYLTDKDLASLRYGHIMIMTDQDQDGSHIKGLLINFLHHNWPGLLHTNFLEEFITPIVKVKRGHDSKSFYSLPEFEEWKRDTPDWNKWSTKYYKGLGTSSSKEAKEYFTDMTRHRVHFKYGGAEDDNCILLAFGKKYADQRKEWLTNFLEERKRRRELGLSDFYLYGKGTKDISYQDFVNKELVLFSNMDNERSIPSIMDGLKPGSRKVLFTCLKRNLKKEMKVAQLAGSVGEHTAYHHGEMSLMGTIINLAQNYVGSNNINLLVPIGQFGTRLLGGKDAASPRYIFTKLSPLAFHIFNKLDEPLLNHQTDDNQKIEPEFYVPIIPMCLVNGADGIGTGWMTKIPNYNPRDIVENIKRLLNEDELVPMQPWFKHFAGTIMAVDSTHYCINGEVGVVDEKTIEITELPIRTWTQNYKESVMEPLLHGTEKSPGILTDYREYHSDTKVHFVVKMSEEKLRKVEAEGLHKLFKLQTSFSLTSMVLFDSNGCLHKYETPEEILQEFFTVRMEYYHKRKKFLEGMLKAESLRLENQARFILEKCSHDLVLENKKRKAILAELIARKYDPDPVKRWKESQKAEADESDVEADSESEQAEEEDAGAADYDYLMTMHMWSLSEEKKNQLLAQRDAKRAELEALRKKTPKVLYLDDLKLFMLELDKVEAQERLDEQAVLKKAIAPASKSGGGRGKTAVKSYAPKIQGLRVEPKVDPDMIKRITGVTGSGEGVKKRGPKKKNSSSLSTSKTDTQDDSDVEVKPLAERLNVESSITAKGTKKPTGGLKQTKLSFPKKTADKKSPAKKRKKNSTSDEEETSMSEDDDDMFLDSDESDRKPVAKTKANTEADQSNLFDSLLSEGSPDVVAVIPKPDVVSSNNNKNNGVNLVSSESDSDVPAAVKPKKVAPPKKRTLAKVASKGSDSGEDRKETKRKKPAAVPRAKKPPKLNFSSTDSDASLDEMIPKSVKRAVADPDSDFDGEPKGRSRAVRAKPPVKYNFDDSDSS